MTHHFRHGFGNDLSIYDMRSYSPRAMAVVCLIKESGEDISEDGMIFADKAIASQEVGT